MNWFAVDKIIKDALCEDIPEEDITTNAIFSIDDKTDVQLIAKERGIIAGVEVFKRVFFILGGAVNTEIYVQDGEGVLEGQIIGKIIGNTRSILTGERVALNILQRMSGIATLTRKYVDIIKGTNAKLLDTRKTTPNLRILEKYSVRVGGGSNHRSNLSDAVLIKDNHISAAGGIKNAIEAVRKNVSFVRKIEVEIESLYQIKEALENKADIIMLDNMSIDNMKKAVNIIEHRALIEASGNVTMENILAIAKTGVDYISVGALTHSYKVLDFSMKKL